jgi:hypothetical protein
MFEAHEPGRRAKEAQHVRAHALAPVRGPFRGARGGCASGLEGRATAFVLSIHGSQSLARRVE